MTYFPLWWHIFDYDGKKGIFPSTSGHWPPLKNQNLAHNCFGHKKWTLKTKWVEYECQYWIAAKINICINLFFWNRTYVQFCKFIICVNFPPQNWIGSVRNIHLELLKCIWNWEKTVCLCNLLLNTLYKKMLLPDSWVLRPDKMNKIEQMDNIVLMHLWDWKNLGCKHKEEWQATLINPGCVNVF